MTPPKPPPCPYCDDRRPKWIDAAKKCCDSCADETYDPVTGERLCLRVVARGRYDEPGKAKREYDGPRDRFA